MSQDLMRHFENSQIFLLDRLTVCRNVVHTVGVHSPHLGTVTNQQYLQKHHSLTDYSWRVLRDCEKALHKWAEDECNGRIQWDDETGEPHLYRKDKWGGYTCKGQPTFNREDYYLDMARKQAARYGLEIYHQTDPRGCALYVYTKSDLERSRYGSDPKFGISAVYNTVATAIC